MDETQAPVIRETFRFIGEVGPLFEALAKAQAEFENIGRNAANPHFKSRYADLSEVLDSVRPALNKHGIALLQPFDGDSVVTMLCLGAARYEVTVALPSWDGPHELGSLLTYIRRYQVKSLLGVNDSEDDDGNAAAQKPPAQRERATPPATKAAPKDSSSVVQGAITPDTKASAWRLAQQAGFTTAELEAFSLKHSLGALGGLSEQNGLILVSKLEGLEVKR